MSERTGAFRYVRHADVDAFHQRGWMVVGDLGPVHGVWSALMWRCDCPELLSSAAKALELERKLSDAALPKPEPARLRKALQSIAANTCCDSCREAALVARAALQGDPDAEAGQ